MHLYPAGKKASIHKAEI